MARGAAAQTMAWHSCAMRPGDRIPDRIVRPRVSSTRSPRPAPRATDRRPGLRRNRRETGRSPAKSSPGSRATRIWPSSQWPKPRVGCAVDDQADADAGADGDVSEIVDALPAAPAHLGQRRAVDVGVERGGHAGRLAAAGRARRRRAQPGLGVVVMRPYVGERGSRSTRPEAGDAKRCEAVLPTPARKDRRQRVPSVSSGVVVGTVSRASNRLGPARENGDAFGPAELDPGVGRQAAA